MFTQKIDKGTNARTHRSVAVIHRAKRHFHWQAFIGHQFHQFTPRNLLINHIVRQTGDTVAFKTQLLQRLPAVGRQPAGDLMQLTVRAGDGPGI